MTTEEAINTIKATARCADGGEYNKFCDALDMAISALRAQQTPPDRSRWEGCDLCLDYETQKPIEDIRGDIVLRFGARTNYLSYGKIYDYRTKKALGNFKFCPFCCRPLTEKAWAELERRINSGTTD